MNVSDHLTQGLFDPTGRPLPPPRPAFAIPRLPLPETLRPITLGDGRRLEPQPRQAEAMLEAYRRFGHHCEGMGVWAEATYKGMGIIGSLDRTQHGTLLHVSFSYPHRLPDWNDVKRVREAFFPDDLDVMMVLAQRRHYVNLHEHTHHIWQMPFPWEVM